MNPIQWLRSPSSNYNYKTKGASIIGFLVALGGILLANLLAALLWYGVNAFFWGLR